MIVTCAGDCGTEFEAKRATAKWCSDRCRKAVGRKAPADVDDAVDPKVSTKDSDLVAAVRKELAAAGRLETVDGQTAILLAKQASAANATGVSALIKELRVALDDAIDGAVLDITCVHCGKKAMKPDVDDEVGQARKLREQKARQAQAR